MNGSSGVSITAVATADGVVERDVDLTLDLIPTMGPNTSTSEEADDEDDDDDDDEAEEDFRAELDDEEEEQSVLRSEAACARREGLKRVKGEAGPRV